MCWLRNGEGGLGKLVVCRGDPNVPRGRVTSEVYQYVLEEGLLPFYEPGNPFIQNNARIYKFGGSPEWLEEHRIWTIDWPAHSPDLNLIKHIWKILKAAIRKIEPNFASLKANIADNAYAEELIQAA